MAFHNFQLLENILNTRKTKASDCDSNHSLRLSLRGTWNQFVAVANPEV
jgi:hypothetical protein